VWRPPSPPTADATSSGRSDSTAPTTRLPGELSGGMQQTRRHLPAQLAIEPKLLLADEPTGTLDQATGVRVVDVLTEHCARTAATIVVATHDAE